MDFEERLILFIDILGFKEFIQKLSTKNPLDAMGLYGLLKTLQNDFTINDDQKLVPGEVPRFSQGRNFSMFSDTIVVSSNDITPNGLDHLLQDANHIFITGVYFGFLFRGAIVQGRIVHEKDIFFGPGLIDAYNLEFTKAIYPRVIVSPALLNEISLKDKDFVDQDSDGEFFVNNFYGLNKRFSTEKSKKLTLDGIERLLRIGLGHQSIKVRKKYEWLEKKMVANKLNGCHF